MEVICHHGKPEDFDSHDTREEFETTSDPHSSMLEVLSRMLVLAAEKPSSHASINAVNDVDLIVRANLLSLSS